MTCIDDNIAKSQQLLSKDDGDEHMDDLKDNLKDNELYNKLKDIDYKSLNTNIETHDYDNIKFLENWISGEFSADTSHINYWFIITKKITKRNTINIISRNPTPNQFNYGYLNKRYVRFGFIIKKLC